VNKAFWRISLLSGALLWASSALQAAPFEWNYPAPVLTPDAASNNGKTVLFDVSHGGTEGNADWVIDGGFSDFAQALVAEGYTVAEYRGSDKNQNGVIDFVDDYNYPTSANSAANEAVITYDAIKHANVLVLAESNRPFTRQELFALEAFVAAGKGIFFIADHYNADRNLNTWDATEVFNGYNRSNRAEFNIGGNYEDLRNPGNASGWLVQNFGIRFRFNAINWLSGVSGVVSISESEGITRGVSPVLMAAGATLAITDPERAKGLVYFAPSDRPSKWGNAIDSGLYYGGMAEGPYVAISKSGAGKAAFIGDSSPIEDSSPKYRREDSGSTKRTHPGWTDSGNAARLSVNIINWLATPESYTRFNSNAHPPGIVTPNPMAAIERNDPDNGQPWSSPRNGYNPWNKTTFAYGAYGAPNGPGGNVQTSSSATSSASSSAGSSTGTLSVSDALSLPTGTFVILSGRITQGINGQYALELVDPGNTSKTIYVKLEQSQRADFSPLLNPEVIGKIIEVSGSRENYMSRPAIKAVTSIKLLGNASSNIETNCDLVDVVSVETVYGSNLGSDLTVLGTVLRGINDPYALELADLDLSTTIYIKLESSQRDEFSPANNPLIIGETVAVHGQRDTYMSYPSLESVDTIQVVSDCDY